jgi:hypothetical protein
MQRFLVLLGSIVVVSVLLGCGKDKKISSRADETSDSEVEDLPPKMKKSKISIPPPPDVFVRSKSSDADK